MEDKLSKHSQKDTETLNSSVFIEKTGYALKAIPRREFQAQIALLVNSTKEVKKEMIAILFNLF